MALSFVSFLLNLVADSWLPALKGWDHVVEWTSSPAQTADRSSGGNSKCFCCTLDPKHFTVRLLFNHSHTNMWLELSWGSHDGGALGAAPFTDDDDDDEICKTVREDRSVHS